MVSRRALGGTALALSLVLLVFGRAARAEDYFVPSLDWPTLQGAINDAAGNGDPVNHILLGASPLIGNFTIGPDFDAGHTLSIHPDAAAGSARVTLLASSMISPVLSLLGVIGGDAGYVTIQDLDILRRDSGSASDLVVVSGMVHVTIERCRVGFDGDVPTTPGFANLKIHYPTEVVVRNCIFFSKGPGGLDRGVDVQGLIDPANSILLYNNLAFAYRLHGFRVNDGGSLPAALVLLRNNIAVNHLGVAPEPVGYRSDVDQATVVTSHNVVFATPGFEESVAAGAVSIGGAGGAFGISMPRAVAVTSFVSTAWAATPPYDANETYFRLNPTGPLHDAATDRGVTVTNGAPHARDIAVVLDIHRQGRPGGVPAHTDRGPDQVDVAIATDVAIPSRTSAFAVELDRNPSREVRLRYFAPREGTLVFELFDLGGRRIALEEREVAAGERGDWDAPRSSAGLVFYRVNLRAPDGSVLVREGKAVTLR